jgi:hypothetical protein
MSGESTADNAPETHPESFRVEHRRLPKRAYLLAMGGVVLGVFAGFSIASQSVPPAPSPSATASPYTLQAPTDWTIPGEGEFLVGKSATADVRPGLYRSSSNLQRCTWQREKDATGEHVIASDSSGGVTYVELHSGEFFDTSECTTWHRVTSPASPR